MVEGEIVKAPARELTPEEWDARVRDARAIELRTNKAIQAGRSAMWALAEALFDFDEATAWTALGYETLADWLSQPEIGMRKSMYYTLVSAWRQLVVYRQVLPDRMERLDWSKVQIVLPAIRASRVDTDQALDDAEALGASDLRVKYIPGADDGDPGGTREPQAPASASEPDDDDSEPEDERVAGAWGQVSEAIASNVQMPRLRRQTLVTLRDHYQPEADGETR